MNAPFSSTLSFGDSAAEECHWQVIGESFGSSVLSDGAVKHAVAGQSKLSHVRPCLGLTLQKTAYSSLEVAQFAEQSWRGLWILPGSLLSAQNPGDHLETEAVYNLNGGLERMVDAVCSLLFVVSVAVGLFDLAGCEIKTCAESLTKRKDK